MVLRNHLTPSEYKAICHMRERLDKIISRIAENEETTSPDGLYNLLASALGSCGQIEEQQDPNEL